MEENKVLCSKTDFALGLFWYFYMNKKNILEELHLLLSMCKILCKYFWNILDIIFHMKIGHAKSLVYSSEISMKGGPLHLRTNTSETLMMHHPM